MEDEVIVYVLLKLGCTKASSVYKFLFVSAKLVIKNPFSIHKLMREVYDVVREQCGLINTRSVSSAICKQVENICNTDKHLIFNDLYKTNMFNLNSKITSGQLIGLIAEYYNLELYTTDSKFYDYLALRNANKKTLNQKLKKPAQRN